MNIQIFGKSKCFDTKKAERFFKERRIKYQYIDINKYGLSLGEFKSVVNSIGIDNIVNQNDIDYPLFSHLALYEDKFNRLFEVQDMIKTPIVRNGKDATVGFCPEIWKNWD